MAKIIKNENYQELKKQSDAFKRHLDSEMHFNSVMKNDLLSFEWLDETDIICPYIDNVIRKPHLALVSEEDVVSIDKAKKVSVETVKHLSKNTQFIDKIDPTTQDVQPSKLLITRREETYNTYENRFAYTLIKRLKRFVFTQEDLIKAFEFKNKKELEYKASSKANGEKINITISLSSEEDSSKSTENKFKKEVEQAKVRLKLVNDYIKSWERHEFMTSLDKAHVPLVLPPIKKTNLIKHSPDFQMAERLWLYLNKYEEANNDITKEGNDTFGDELLKGILDDSFMSDFFVLESISKSKKEQKEKISDYAVIMATEQIKRIVTILLNNGIKVTKNQILDLVFSDIKQENKKVNTGSKKVQKKFKSAIDEYIERTQDYL